MIVHLDIPTTGVHQNVKDAAYRLWPAVSKSGLDSWVKPRKGSAAFTVGHAVHVWLLEGQTEFYEQYHVADRDYNLTRKVDKDYVATIIHRTGKRVLKPKQFDEIDALVGAVQDHPLAAKILAAPGDNEVSVFGRHDGFETDCKCRIDMVRRESLWDLKTTHARSQPEFKDSIAKYGYAMQGAWYHDLYQAVTGDDKPFYFLCVSKVPDSEGPAVWVEQLTYEAMAFGRKHYRDLLTLHERLA